MGFKRLTTRFLLIVLALFMVTGAVSTVVLLFAVEGIIHRLGTSYAFERAELERARIGRVLDTEAILARKLADSPSLVHWFLDEGNPALRRAAFEELESFRRAFRDKDYFIAVGSSLTYYIQPTEGPIAVTTLSKKNPADAWYFNTVAAGLPSSFNLDYDRLIGAAKVWINCVVRSKGNVIGLAGTGLDITDLIKQIVRSERSGVRTILIDSTGAITAERNRRSLEQNALAGAYGKKITIYDLVKSAADRRRLAALIASAASGKPEIGTVELGGRANLTVVDAIPEIGWYAVVTVDPSSVISFLDFLPLFGLLVASLLAVLIAISLLMERLVLRPLVTMTSSARQIASGDYGLSLPSGRSDEMGALASAFNEMAAKVKGYTESLEALAERLSSHSLFHRQRDIVGGDFLFYRDFGEGYLLGVVDCAGHGVPGALMTMMASSTLQMIAARVRFDEPAAMLAELDEVFRASLRHDKGQLPVRGGLDVGLCACLPNEGELVFAGAGMPLYLLSPDGQVATIPGRRGAIGHGRRRSSGLIENRRLATEGQTFFLVTDGYVDQAGGTTGRAYGTRRLTTLFASCLEGPLDALRLDWASEFDAYRGDQAQRDDVLAIGFRV